MTKRTRTILFLLSALTFLILAPALILYVQGYRWDWQNRKLTRTGAFYFRVLPKSSNILLDSKLVKKTDFFFGSAFLEDLLPGTYAVEIKKEGYSPWKKNLAIEPMKATEAKAIVLFPQSIGFEKKTSGADYFLPSPAGDKVLLLKKDNQGWYLTVSEPDQGKEKIILKQADLGRKNLSSFLGAQWSADSKKLILHVGLNEQENFFLLDAETRATPLSLDILGTIQKIDFDPKNSQRFVFLKSAGLFSGIFSSLNPSLFATLGRSALDFTFDENQLYSLDKDGFVWKTDLAAGRNPQKLNDVPFAIKPEIPYRVFVSSQMVFLQAENDLFRLDEKTGSFDKIDEEISGFAIAPDAKKMVFWKNGEIWFFALKKIFEQPSRQPGDRFLLTRFSEKIKNLFWLNNDYLIFDAGSKIEIGEIDDRDRPNLIEADDFKDPELFFSEKTKKASVLTEGNLFFSENLLPY